MVTVTVRTLWAYFKFRTRKPEGKMGVSDNFRSRGRLDNLRAKLGSNKHHDYKSKIAAAAILKIEERQ
jgi:hypothetical protein